jgi:hypothetical protein
VLVGSQDFAMYFWDEVLSQDMAHIDDLPLMGDTHVTVGILSSCVACRPFNLTWTILSYFSFMSLLTNFDKRIM